MYIVTPWKTCQKPLYTLSVDQDMIKRLGPEHLHMANALGLLSDLTRYVNLRQHFEPSDLEQRLSVPELKQRINHRINIASLEVLAVASEKYCEEKRTSQVANYLKGSESNTESKLTIAAIVVGVTGSITTGGLINNASASNTAGVATGITEASLSLLILFDNRKIDFYHKRNALREVWKGKPVSSNFPPFVWYYLTDPSKELPSVRQAIVDKWEYFGQISGR